jgi:predicted aconitase with swiveling domain
VWEIKRELVALRGSSRFCYRMWTTDHPSDVDSVALDDRAALAGLLTDGAGRQLTFRFAALPWNRDNLVASQALLDAARRGDTAPVEEWFPTGPDCVDDRGWTPLCRAAQGGHLDTAKLLLEARADVEKGVGGHTAVLIACERGMVEMVQILVKAGADIEKEVVRGKVSLTDYDESKEWAEPALMLRNGEGQDLVELFVKLAMEGKGAAYLVKQLIFRTAREIERKMECIVEVGKVVASSPDGPSVKLKCLSKLAKSLRVRLTDADAVLHNCAKY